MRTFKSQKNLYIKKELLNCGISLAGVAILFILNNTFSFFSRLTFIQAVAFMLFLIALDAIKEFHVHQIHIDSKNKKVNILLKSILSGEKFFAYSLNEISTDFNDKRARFSLFRPARLFIYLPGKKYFKISNRYGFSSETLEEIHNVLVKEKFANLS